LITYIIGGASAVSMIERAMKRGISIQFERNDGIVTFREISLCKKGRRDNTWVYQIWVLEKPFILLDFSSPPTMMKSYTYTHHPSLNSQNEIPNYRGYNVTKFKDPYTRLVTDDISLKNFKSDNIFILPNWIPNNNNKNKNLNLLSSSFSNFSLEEEDSSSWVPTTDHQLLLNIISRNSEPLWEPSYFEMSNVNTATPPPSITVNGKTPIATKLSVKALNVVSTNSEPPGEQQQQQEVPATISETVSNTATSAAAVAAETTTPPTTTSGSGNNDNVGQKQESPAISTNNNNETPPAMNTNVISTNSNDAMISSNGKTIVSMNSDSVMMTDDDNNTPTTSSSSTMVLGRGAAGRNADMGVLNEITPDLLANPIINKLYTVAINSMDREIDTENVADTRIQTLTASTDKVNNLFMNNLSVILKNHKGNNNPASERLNTISCNSDEEVLRTIRDPAVFDTVAEVADDINFKNRIVTKFGINEFNRLYLNGGVITDTTGDVPMSDSTTTIPVVDTPLQQQQQPVDNVISTNSNDGIIPPQMNGIYHPLTLGTNMVNLPQSNTTNLDTISKNDSSQDSLPAAAPVATNNMLRKLMEKNKSTTSRISPLNSTLNNKMNIVSRNSSDNNNNNNNSAPIPDIATYNIATQHKSVVSLADIYRKASNTSSIKRKASDLNTVSVNSNDYQPPQQQQQQQNNNSNFNTPVKQIVSLADVMKKQKIQSTKALTAIASV